MKSIFTIMPDGKPNLDDVAKSTGKTLAEVEALYKKEVEYTKINIKTQSEIFTILSVDNERSAMITQANLQGEATSIIASKTIGGKYPKGGEARLKEIGKIKDLIFNAVKFGREAKAKL